MLLTSGKGMGIDHVTMSVTYSSSIQDVLSFTQMKPEKISIELTEEEKAALALLKEQSSIGLIELKEKAGLSNKKWDVSIKGLTGK